MALAQNQSKLLHTPLYDRHVALGGRMVPFAGYTLPVYYTSIIDEHRWVRSACGIFDVSHLGEIVVKGAGAFPFLQKVVPTDLSKIGDHEILYTVVLNESGGIIDDVLVYRHDMQSFYLVVNAARIAMVLNHFKGHLPEHVELLNESFQCACVAIQGPKSPEVVEKFFGQEPLGLKYYGFMPLSRWGRTSWISRTGYTGEDGFEVFSDNATIVKIWDGLFATQRQLPVRAVGLGARNTLRLEVGNALNGTDMNETLTPFEARLAWVVSAAKGDFVGREKLFERKVKGFRHRLSGFRVNHKAVAREGSTVWKDGRTVGRVTSGSYSPSLDMNIGLAYVESPLTNVGTQIEIEVHGRRVPATIMRLPFVPVRHV